MSPLSSPHIGRDMVRALPFNALKEFAENVANAGTLIAAFEIGSTMADRNQLGTSPAPASSPFSATGPYLDAVVFSAAVGSLLVEYAIGKGFGVAAPTYHAVTPATVVPASTLTNISGLRVTARYVRVTFTNTSGAAADTELGVYIRST